MCVLEKERDRELMILYSTGPSFSENFPGRFLVESFILSQIIRKIRISLKECSI